MVQSVCSSEFKVSAYYDQVSTLEGCLCTEYITFVRPYSVCCMPDKANVCLVASFTHKYNTRTYVGKICLKKLKKGINYLLFYKNELSLFFFLKNSFNLKFFFYQSRC